MLVTHLTCLRCGVAEELSDDTYLCRRCGNGGSPSDAGILDVHYDYDAARRQLFNGSKVSAEGYGVFRYLPLLPVNQPGPVPPVGGTPLYEARALAGTAGAAAVYLKDETRNPTRAHKDRATAIGVTRARALGCEDIYCASSGNAAISLAGFSAFAGMRAHVFVPHAASEVRLTWLKRFGADVTRSEGDYDVAYDEAEEMRARGWYSRNCAFNPFLVEGKKTLGLEIAEQLDWQVPDLVVCPVGDACSLGGIGKAFRELADMGVTDKLPRLIGVQSSAVKPVLDRLRELRGESPEPATETQTAAASINVRNPRNMQRLLNEIDVSRGTIIAVDDAAIGEEQRELAEKAGLVAEFTSASTLAGLRRLGEQESLDGLRAVLIITGGRPDDG